VGYVDPQAAGIGVFVTLELRGRLRGCVGTLETSAPLADTIEHMAEAAAMHDPRFPPLSPAELAGIHLELSLLSPLKRIASTAEINLGEDGVMVRRGRASGVFLPQVARETGWNRERFIQELCESKAGFSAALQSDPKTEWFVFSATVIEEK
jgi:AmmeMemoRadiSam system protein A